MWTFFLDAAAANLCRAYKGVAGHFPTLCLVNSGYPMLGICAVVLFAMFCLMVAWRSYRA